MASPPPSPQVPTAEGPVTSAGVGAAAPGDAAADEPTADTSTGGPSSGGPSSGGPSSGGPSSGGPSSGGPSSGGQSTDVDVARPDGVSEGDAASGERVGDGSRVVLAPVACAWLAAGTLAAAPFGAAGLGLASSPQAGHSVLDFAWAKIDHRVGNNGWLYQSDTTGLVVWAAGFAVAVLLWLGVVAVGVRARRRGRVAAWGASALASGLLLLAAGGGAILAARLAPADPLGLDSAWSHAADLGSPLLASALAVAVLAWREHLRRLAAAAAVYALGLAAALLWGLPDAAAVAVAAVLGVWAAVAAWASAPARSAMR